jgi:hypothetical protein
MSVPALRALPRVEACDLARIERQLSRFHPDLRLAARALAGRHPRLGQLSLSFPALFTALAMPRAGREAAITAVIAGASLRTVAGIVRVPLWLRSLKPRLLPAILPDLPDGPFLARRIANHRPRRPAQVARWFEAVSQAARWVDEDFAVWCARVALEPVGRRRSGIHLLCLWAWYSRHPETRAGALIRRPWFDGMARAGAVEQARRWHERIELECNLGGRAFEPWLTPGTADGYAFVPLRDAPAIDAEAEAMANCVRTYGYGMAHDNTRLWSVQRDGVRVATMSISTSSNDPLPVIGELLLSSNREAPVEMWWAARRWLNGHDLLPFANLEKPWHSVPLDTATWRALWKPFWLAHSTIPAWLPLQPARHVLDEL